MFDHNRNMDRIITVTRWLHKSPSTEREFHGGKNLPSSCSPLTETR